MKTLKTESTIFFTIGNHAHLKIKNILSFFLVLRTNLALMLCQNSKKKKQHNVKCQRKIYLAINVLVNHKAWTLFELTGCVDYQLDCFQLKRSVIFYQPCASFLLRASAPTMSVLSRKTGSPFYTA